MDEHSNKYYFGYLWGVHQGYGALNHSHIIKTPPALVATEAHRKGTRQWTTKISPVSRNLRIQGKGKCSVLPPHSASTLPRLIAWTPPDSSDSIAWNLRKFSVGPCCTMTSSLFLHPAGLNRKLVLQAHLFARGVTTGGSRDGVQQPWTQLFIDSMHAVVTSPAVLSKVVVYFLLDLPFW